MNELLSVSANFLFLACVVLLWNILIVDLFGEIGTSVVCSFSIVCIFFSFPLYFVEYFLTGYNFKDSTSGVIFLISSVVCYLCLVGSFLFNKMFKSNESLFDKMSKKYKWFA
jgi:hypothetical protein